MPYLASAWGNQCGLGSRVRRPGGTSGGGECCREEQIPRLWHKRALHHVSLSGRKLSFVMPSFFGFLLMCPISPPLPCQPTPKCGEGSSEDPVDKPVSASTAVSQIQPSLGYAMILLRNRPFRARNVAIIGSSPGCKSSPSKPKKPNSLCESKKNKRAACRGV